MNNVTLSGRLIDGPVIRLVDNHAACGLRLAVERRGFDERVDVIVVTCAGQLGLDALSQLTAGDVVGVDGWLRSHEVADGGDSGVQRTDVVADRVDRLGHRTVIVEEPDAHLESAYEDRYELDEAL
jgi:single-stranded DNA-binding protein